jgi:HD-GYP domain-containing protein (c-di-GMP phosphodiesterase class II)
MSDIHIKDRKAEEAVDLVSAEEQAFLRQVGKALVNHLFSAGKTIRLYDMKNRATQRVLGDVAETLRTLFAREPRAVLRVSNDFLLLNDHRIQVDSQHYVPFEFMVQEMRSRQVESIEFVEGVGTDELGLFLTVFFDVEPGESAHAEVERRLAEADVSSIRTTVYVEQEARLKDLEHEDQDLKRASNRVYFRTVALMGDVLKTIREKNILNVRKARRLTQQMVDIIRTDESLLVGLASIKNFDAYTFAHSVNVCILSMLMGDRLGLPKPDVARLGVSALLHDVGKTYIPSTIINSTGELTPREWELMKYHTFFGVKELSRMKALGEAVDPMFVALQHHVHLNDNGYPQRPGGWQLRLFSRICTVADYFDAMTASRTYQKDPVTPDRALRFILEKSGEIFDPFIAKVFIRAMGLYPVGTVVELDTGQVGVVIRQSPDVRHIHRPTVQLVDTSTPERADGDVVDLSETTSAGAYRRTIERTTNDVRLGIDRRSIFVDMDGSAG